ncbi:MAG: hypothetical protein QM704_07985 [Anaeromyxobacteraceae bacterium]
MNARTSTLALLLAAGLAPAVAHASSGMKSSIEDDYPAALAAAKARNVPIVVDVWAPW